MTGADGKAQGPAPAFTRAADERLPLEVSLARKLVLLCKDPEETYGIDLLLGDNRQQDHEGVNRAVSNQIEDCEAE